MILPNNIYHGDCYELIKQIPDKSVDLVITDPPYSFSTKGLDSGLFKYRNLNKTYQEIENNGIANGINLNILNELCRVLKYIYIYIYGAIKNKSLII